MPEAKILDLSRDQTSKTLARDISDRLSQELVIALVGPIASGVSTSAKYISEILAQDFDYEVAPIIKPSDIIRAEAHRVGVGTIRSDPISSYINQMQDTGNSLREKFGPDYYSFRSDDLAGYVLNSSLIAAPEHAQAEASRQEEWLKAELAKARADGVRYRVIFQHHPWFLESADEPDQYFNIPTATRKRYLKLFHESGVTHVFAGHYHRNAYGRDGSLEMITSGPMGKFLGDAPSGMRVVIWGDNGIDHRYYGFGSVPHEVEVK